MAVTAFPPSECDECPQPLASRLVVPERGSGGCAFGRQGLRGSLRREEVRVEAGRCWEREVASVFFSEE